MRYMILDDVRVCLENPNTAYLTHAWAIHNFKHMYTLSCISMRWEVSFFPLISHFKDRPAPTVLCHILAQAGRIFLMADMPDHKSLTGVEVLSAALLGKG